MTSTMAIHDYVRRIVDDAPLLTDEQRVKLAAIIQGGRARPWPQSSPARHKKTAAAK